MTRINLLHPSQLTVDHLRGEYKELPRVFTHVRNAIEKGLRPSDFQISDRYLLGTGHVTFFYDKLGFMIRRYHDLYGEMIRRGFSPNREMFLSINASYDEIDDCWKGEYTPTPEDIYLNMSRLCIRSKLPNVLGEIRISLTES